MPTEFKLPQLGEQVEKGVVLSVMVSPGDHVDADDVGLELETDKATTEVPAPSAGTVGEVRVGQGDEIQSGDVIMTLQDDEQTGDDEEVAEEKDEEKAEEEPDEEPQQDQEPEAKEEKLEKEEKEESEQRARPEKTERKKEPRKEKPPRPKLGEPAPAAPSVRRFARELGLDVSTVAGTGSGGRVTEEDVKSHVRDLLDGIEKTRDEQEQKLPDFSQWGEVEREPMNAIRRATADNVTSSWERIPHVTQYDDADITELEDFRARFADDAEEDGGKLTVTAILVKVVAAALGRFPQFNASVDLERGEVIRKKYVHVGVAVDTKEGLLVPVLRDADKKGLMQIAKELGELAGKARARKLSREAMQGGSFSITNLGGLGTTRFTPIVGWPQVAILSVGRLDTKPVWQGDEFAPRKVLPLGITYDHRAVDGADAARFLRWIAETLETPMRLTMEG